jgi:hypothetical protein
VPRSSQLYRDERAGHHRAKLDPPLPLLLFLQLLLLFLSVIPNGNLLLALALACHPEQSERQNVHKSAQKTPGNQPVTQVTSTI